MSVNLDQIEFYHGPSRPPPYTNAKSVPPDHVPAHVPPCFQQTFPAGFGFRPEPWEVPLGQSLPLAGTTHEWNIFDFEINNVYGPTLPETRKDVELAVTPAIPAARDILLDRGSSALAFAEPVPLTDSAKTIPCPAGPNSLEHISPDMRGNDLQGKLAHHMAMKVGHHTLSV
ncbi:hypothetical protein N7509_003930 [Penicillium cosmopolitanum]|uniref:Uncharacterized protein n=1 Tax=Penicillium cosmopolitanum TaxID=1131564 RepID=A0A9W9W5U2_9EURO|nr:uncharacterized protein N7509_003930 [Penicillium cosmopolitanum]KAJ5404059.1 hypothetical protein N7509_003930 [Penicillium cosmopolitanum]